MKARIAKGNINEKRLLNTDELCIYTGLGRCTARKYAESIGAVKRFGRRVMFDKSIIDVSLSGGEEDGKTQK